MPCNTIRYKFLFYCPIRHDDIVSLSLDSLLKFNSSFLSKVIVPFYFTSLEFGYFNHLTPLSLGYSDKLIVSLNSIAFVSVAWSFLGPTLFI